MHWPKLRWGAYLLFFAQFVTGPRTGGFIQLCIVSSLLMISIQKCLFQVLMQMGQNVKLTIGGADINGWNTTDSYVNREGELVGCIKLVKLWHAIGHTVRIADIIYDVRFIFLYKDCRAHHIDWFYQVWIPVLNNHNCRCWDAIFITSGQHTLGEDWPESVWGPENPSYKNLSPLPSCPGHVFYRSSSNGRPWNYVQQKNAPPHRSPGSSLCLGDNDHLWKLYRCIERLRLHILYLPGNAIIICGRILPHEVEEWGPGQRISIAHFTHSSLWKSEDMTCP